MSIHFLHLNVSGSPIYSEFENISGINKPRAIHYSLVFSLTRIQLTNNMYYQCDEEYRDISHEFY